MTPSLEGLPTKAKEAPSPHEVKLALLYTNPVFQSLGGKLTEYWVLKSGKEFFCAKCVGVFVFSSWD